MRFSALLRYSLAAVVLLLAAPRAVHAQVGATTDIIMGKVTGPDTTPVVGARVEVTSAETGITRRKNTNEKGEYSILFPDGGGSYTIKVSFLGFGPYSGSVARQSDEDRLIQNVRLTRNPQVLAGVQVRATNGQQQQDRPTAGSQERNLSAAQLDRLPIDKGDLASIASLAPGVIASSATDSTAAAFSVGGQPTNQNQITLDGLSFGSGSVPSEAVRSTRVITNTYDVSRGQFTGGQVASTTRGGTNNVQGVVTYALRDPDLQYVDEASATFGQKYMQNSLSFGTGGPIVEDEMFIFGAASVSRRTNPLSSLLAANTQTLTRLGAAQDSVTRFLSRLDQIGVRATLPGIPDERLNDNASAIVRYDWSIGELNTLTLRGDWRGQLQDATRISSTAVPSTGGDLKTTGGGLMATLTSHVHGLINEARIYNSRDRQNTDPYLIAPDGRVTIAGRLADGTQSVTNLQFGGNPSLPQESHSTLLELSDEVSYVTRGGAHRVKLGGLLNADRSTVGNIANRYGTFLYNSLADFEANRPAQFTRTLSGRERLAGSNNAALYLGDAWRKSPRIQMVYGMRFEGTRFPRNPDYNPEVETLFGLRTDHSPSELSVSPRLGFTYSMGAPAADRRDAAAGGAAGGDGGGRGGRGGGFGGGQGGQGGGPGGFNASAWTIRGGLGQFRGRINSNLVATAVDATGLLGGQSTLTCIGAAVPVPDWTAYLSDAASIPTQCLATSGPPVAIPLSGQRRNVTTFASDFSAPKVWRASLGGSRRYLQRYNFSVDGSLAYGINQTGSHDLNLDATPKFTLGSEGGRPVYSAPTSIIATTGATSISASRLHPEYGSVSEIISQNRSLSTQVTVSTGGVTLRGITVNGSYTWLRSRDQQSGFSTGGGGFGGANTAGDPNIVQWGTSDLERRHSMLGTMTFPARAWLDITAIGRMTAGQKYTPIVSGDVNGDGFRNDRAFIFNPVVTTDTALSNGIARVISNSPSRVSTCLQSQLGNVAGRNSCGAPWTPTLDIQLNMKPDAFGLARRLALQVQLQNALVGIDQLLHGDNLHGWGQPVVPDRTLLFVRGFDPATQQFKYQVNEHFGVPSGANSAFRVPFQIGLQGRLTVGQDPARQQIGRMFGTGADGKPLSKEEWKVRLSRVVPNPFQRTLALDDSLKLALTAEQKVQLKSLSDNVAVQADRIAEELADVLTSAGITPDPQVIGARMQGKTQEARKVAEQSVADLKAALTPEQWAKLPDAVKTVPPDRGLGGGFGGGEGGGGGGRGGRGPG
ncbi:MAG: carboxypeptidase regulatory-like domain-containing protein [Gemmatimonadaceae bacterium]